jgi:hypothetical protein
MDYEVLVPLHLCRQALLASKIGRTVSINHDYAMITMLVYTAWSCTTCDRLLCTESSGCPAEPALDVICSGESAVIHDWRWKSLQPTWTATQDRHMSPAARACFISVLDHMLHCGSRYRRSCQSLQACYSLQALETTATLQRSPPDPIGDCHARIHVAAAMLQLLCVPAAYFSFFLGRS